MASAMLYPLAYEMAKLSERSRPIGSPRRVSDHERNGRCRDIISMDSSTTDRWYRMPSACSIDLVRSRNSATVRPRVG